MKILSTLLLVCCSMGAYSQQQDAAIEAAPEACGSSCTCGSGTQTPLGVMTDHIHGKGEWMASYTYMDMMMKGNRMGTKNASDNDVYSNYMMAPKTMNMQMHMVMLMYGVTDRLTLMAMGGYSRYTMGMTMSDNMISMPGMVMTPGNMNMSSVSSGLSDTKLSALYNLSHNENTRIIASGGIGLPTGTIKATGTTMLGENQRLPYDMQPGTGSFSVMPDITYIHQYNNLSVGADAGAEIRLNNNTIGYRTGNIYRATAWAAYRFLPFVSASLRADVTNTGKISGSDPMTAIEIYQQNDPTTSTANYGGTVSNVFAGLNFHINKMQWSKLNLLLEYGMPVYQDLRGIQMAQYSSFQGSLQYKF
jgi:hypothetical protein